MRPPSTSLHSFSLMHHRCAGPVGRCLRLFIGLRLGATLFFTFLVSFLLAQSDFLSLHGRLPMYRPFISFMAVA